ncbi:biotin-dependent carboxyltransferase family protein [Lacrimispora sp.]|uniref:5-oxoprolinase subunit C family protein n=1 Tax=Lacrimispora sp. TaxID=2719234 RepID=UPI0028AFB0E1|nr:biotin-dependent carboxyltransferase family protein [Lacrimispora sp.]
MGLEILRPGTLSTVQDKGRRGYLSQGFQESGACDKYSMKLANLLAGNLEEPETAAVIEFTLKGGEIRFTSDEIIALAGGDMKPCINGIPVPIFSPILVRTGDILTMELAVSGLRTYMAVYGGVEVPSVMGSRSTNLKCRMGGLEGRALLEGDLLESGKDLRQFKKIAKKLKGNEKLAAVGENEPWLRHSSTPYRFYGDDRMVLLRAVMGPQENAFTELGLNTLVRNPFRLSRDCDRMACRLEGEPIEMKNGADIISDGIVEGSVQISSSGLPMVLMADHQTTGGYAKIATVISTDIPALAQLMPGEWVAFQYITPGEAIAICRKEDEKLRKLKERLMNAIYR